MIRRVKSPESAIVSDDCGTRLTKEPGVHDQAAEALWRAKQARRRIQPVTRLAASALLVAVVAFPDGATSAAEAGWEMASTGLEKVVEVVAE